MIKAAIFDYGDTLVRHRIPFEDILPKAVRANYRFFSKAGLKTSFEEFSAVNRDVFAEFSEVEANQDRDIPDARKYDELVRRLFPTRPRAWRSKIAGSANKRFHDFGARYRQVAKGAKATLEELESMGLKMAVLSNHSDQQALVRSLKQFELNSYFARIYSSSQLGARKPNRRAFAKCLAALRVRADQTVFVGDSLRKDVAGAKACGMVTIFVDQGTKHENLDGIQSPDFTVTTLSKIPRIIRRLNTPSFEGFPAEAQ